MRTASFFILSLALHIGALLYPVPFRERLEEQLFPVTILPVEPGPANAPDGGSTGERVSRVSSKPAAIAPEPAKPVTEVNSPPSQPEQQSIAAETAATISESPAVAEFSQPSNTESALAYSRAHNDGSAGVDTTGNGGGGNNAGGSFGAGSGNGNGQGMVQSTTVLTQVRYSETPKPAYPESARRDGREGRVLLRVLVDDQGRAKTVEVNISSGNEILDQAAAEAIKRWRFHPARYGEKPVESWIRIPIEFRLASANP